MENQASIMQQQLAGLKVQSPAQIFVPQMVEEQIPPEFPPGTGSSLMQKNKKK
jgi:hypothetical protein